MNSNKQCNNTMKTPGKSKAGKNHLEDSFENDNSLKASKAKKSSFDEDDDMEFENFEDFIELDFDEDDDY